MNARALCLALGAGLMLALSLTAPIPARAELSARLHDPEPRTEAATDTAPDTDGGERVVAGLSRDSIGITASFDGSEILIYGAVKRFAPEPRGPLDVIVTLEGPSTAVTVRRKSREYGVWLNSASVGIASSPSYYAIASSGPLAKILSPGADVTQRISLPLAIRSFDGPLQVDDPVPFTEALLRIRENEALYSLDEHAVKIVEDTLFRADFMLPANLIEGDYKVRIFLMRNGVPIDVYRAPIEVRRVGLERWLYSLSRNQPAIYGALSLALAVFAGWAAAQIFRFIRNS